MMVARVATTLDAYEGRVIKHNESPSNLGWGFRHSPVFYRASNILNYPSYVYAFPAIARELAERNAQLPKEVSELIERTWGMYFG